MYRALLVRSGSLYCGTTYEVLYGSFRHSSTVSSSAVARFLPAPATLHCFLCARVVGATKTDYWFRGSFCTKR